MIPDGWWFVFAVDKKGSNRGLSCVFCVFAVIWSDFLGKPRVTFLLRSEKEKEFCFELTCLSCPKDHWTLKTGYLEDPTPAIQAQTLPLQGLRSLGWFLLKWTKSSQYQIYNFLQISKSLNPIPNPEPSERTAWYFHIAWRHRLASDDFYVILDAKQTNQFKNVGFFVKLC